MVGSTMVRSPLFCTFMYCFGCLDSYCSAISGDTLGLNPPLPIPNTMTPIAKQATAPFGWAMTEGSVDIMRMMWPTMAMNMEIWIVLKRPQYWSAT